MTQAPCSSPSTWSYVALDPSNATRKGILSAGSGAEVRAQLRRQGLTPVRVRPQGSASTRFAAFRQPVESWLRSRRQTPRARLFESLATLTETGLSLSEALGTLTSSTRRRSRSLSTLLVSLSAEVDQGQPFSIAMGAHPGWFGRFDIAMVHAGQERGELASVLRALADRERRSGELSAKLTGALAYPMLVGAVGLVVVVILSTKALPQLVGVLESAGVEPPRLTQFVMSLGTGLARFGPLIALSLVTLLAATMVGLASSRRRGFTLPRRVVRLMPEAFRKLRTASVAVELAELVRCGVPLPEALRVAAGTQQGLLAGGLGKELDHAADQIDEGESFSSTLGASVWFDSEHVRLLEIGETSGELGGILASLGNAELRAAQRAVDHFASMLQPAAILALAVVIGFVVMAAIQPIVKLQEIIG